MNMSLTRLHVLTSKILLLGAAVWTLVGWCCAHATLPLNVPQEQCSPSNSAVIAAVSFRYVGQRTKIGVSDPAYKHTCRDVQMWPVIDGSIAIRHPTDKVHQPPSANRQR